MNAHVLYPWHWFKNDGGANQSWNIYTNRTILVLWGRFLEFAQFLSLSNIDFCLTPTNFKTAFAKCVTFKYFHVNSRFACSKVKVPLEYCNLVFITAGTTTISEFYVPKTKF